MSIAVILCLPGYVCSNFVFWVLGADHLFHSLTDGEELYIQELHLNSYVI